MCGIFALLNNKDIKINTDFIKEQFNKASHRGPDNSKIENRNNDFIGFHRLAINGLDIQSGVILYSGKTVLYAIENTDRKNKGDKKVSIPFQVENLKTTPDDPLEVYLDLNIMFK